MSSNWSRERSSPKKGSTSDSGQIREDAYSALWKDRKNTNPARVSMTVAEGMDYGAMRVSATVTLACDQDEPTINKAGELAFYKALELIRDGWKELGCDPPQEG